MYHWIILIFWRVQNFTKSLNQFNQRMHEAMLKECCLASKWYKLRISSQIYYQDNKVLIQTAVLQNVLMK